MRKTMLNLYLDQDQFNFIAKRSAETGRSRAAIVRELVKQYQAKYTQKGVSQNGGKM